ncbi:MAG TPA: glycine-rich protein [Gaiellaceae bacterium]
MSTSVDPGRTGPYAGRTRNGIAGRKSRALPARRLALAAVVAGFATWLFAGTGADTRSVSREFAFTGGRAHFVVPAGVCRVRIEAAGASGGLQGAAGTPGLGARVAATLRVSPAETLLVHVGGQGGTALGGTPGRGGWNGGGDGGAAIDRADGSPGRAGSGGGGATDVRRGAGRLEDRILVAGGGAGGGGGGIVGTYGMTGGEGGSPAGNDGFARLGAANPATGGHGGTQSAGGTPGANAPDGAVTAAGGSPGLGGLGASGGVNGGGGGGGGLYGGGGGGTELQWTTRPLGATQGGGGSSFGPPETTYRSGVWGNLGDGWTKISYDADACVDPPTHSDG